MDSFFFISAKVLWTLARPESWLVLLSCISLFSLITGKITKARNSLLTNICLMLVIGLFPVADILLKPLQTRFPTKPAIDAPRGIIILGGAEDSRMFGISGLPEVNEAADRFLIGIALAEQHPKAKVIFTGGTGNGMDDDATGADVIVDLFSLYEIDDARLLLERRSRNTAENATYLSELVVDVSSGPWVLVTSAFHMPRSMGAFCNAGWRNIIPYPVDFRSTSAEGKLTWSLAKNLAEWNVITKEWIGLVAYQITGRTQTLLPTAC